MRGVLLILFSMSVAVCFGQLRYDANWVFGYGCGMRYDSPIYSFPVNSAAYSSSTTLSNDDGSLKLYFSGSELRDNSNSVILNGDSIWNLRGGFSNLILISFPTKSIIIGNYLYDIFTCPYLQCTNLVYSVINNDPISLQVIEKNVRIPTPPIDSRLALIKHANGNSWWLLTHDIYIGAQSVNSYYRFLISEDTIIGPEIQKIGYHHNDTDLYFGDIAVSKSGNMVAFSLVEKGVIELYDFDRCTGLLSNLRTITGPLNNKYSAMDFSPSERFLYVNTGRGYEPNALYQLDLTQADISASAVQLWYTQEFDTIHTGGLKLAPDGKLYMGCRIDLTDTTGLNGLQRKLSVIHDPDSLGIACDFRLFDFELNQDCRIMYALPHIPNYNLGPFPVYMADAGRDTFFCASDSTIKALPIGGDSIYGVTYQWQAAPGIDTLNSRTQLVIPPAQSRWYYVTLTDTNYIGPSCNSRLDSVYVEVRNCDTVGIIVIKTLQAKLYPNPTNGLLTVEVPQGTGGYIFRLFNLLGQQVLEYPLEHDKTTFPLDFAKGIYLYQITAHNGQVQVGKLVVGD